MMNDTSTPGVASTGRNQSIDFMRGSIIFLMLWGHCIQYISPNGTNFYADPVFKFIYSFHMPMFALISGYIFGFSVQKRGMPNSLSSRVLGLVRPIVFGSLLNYLIINLPTAISSLQFQAFFSKEMLYTSSDLWFLWSILGSVTALSLAIGTTTVLWKQLIIVIAISPFLFALPNSELNVYMYPFFVLGWLFLQCKNFAWMQVLQKLKYLCIPLFLLMLCFFDEQHYIYTSGLFGGHGRLDSLSIDLFRYAIGFFGCITALTVGMWLITLMKKSPFLDATVVKGLASLGQKSLQIYILSCSLLSWYLPKWGQFIFPFVTLPSSSITLIAPGVALLYCVALYWIVKLMERIGLSKIIFGR